MPESLFIEVGRACGLSGFQLIIRNILGNLFYIALQVTASGLRFQREELNNS